MAFQDRWPAIVVCSVWIDSKIEKRGFRQSTFTFAMIRNKNPNPRHAQAQSEAIVNDIEDIDDQGGYFDLLL